MRPLPLSKIVAMADFRDETLVPFLRQIPESRNSPSSDLTEYTEREDWEQAMMLRAFAQFGLLRTGSVLAGVGAGTNEATFLLASRGCITFPADTYLGVNRWSNLAPAAFMVRPRQFTDLAVSRTDVVPVHADLRALNLPSAFFDGAYCPGALGRLRSQEEAQAAMREIARILKPEGVASIVVDYRIDGPNDLHSPVSGPRLFSEAEIHALIEAAPGMTLVGPLDTGIDPGILDGRVVLEQGTDPDFRQRDHYERGNLVGFRDGFVYGCAHLTLQKTGTPRHRGRRRTGLEREVEAEAVETAGQLLGQMRDWADAFRPKQQHDPALARRVPREQHEALERQLAQARAETRRMEVMLANALLLPRTGATTPGQMLDGLGASARALAEAAPRLPTLSFSWQEAYSSAGAELFTNVGVKVGRVLRSQGREGFLCFGPYVPAEAGHYLVHVVFDGNSGAGEIAMDACSDSGATILVRAGVPVDAAATEATMEFSLLQAVPQLEVRIYAPAGADVGLASLTIQRLVMTAG